MRLPWWSDLMPLMTWELWLARDIVADNPLPWQKSIDKLTPGRVAQAGQTHLNLYQALTWYSRINTPPGKKTIN